MCTSTVSISTRATVSRGFTLVELLVVISIVALLVALLLPSLSKARDTAVSMQCLSRYRNLSIPGEMFRYDHYGYYAPNNSYSKHSSQPQKMVTGNYFDSMEPYLDGGFAGTNPGHPQYGPDGNFMLCPASPWTGHYITLSAVEVRKTTYISTGWNLTNYMTFAYFGYGNMSSWANYTAPSQQIWPQRYLPKREIRTDPSRQAWVGEIRSVSPALGYIANFNMVNYWHNGKTNLLFADGHAQTMNDTLNQHWADRDIVIYH